MTYAHTDRRAIGVLIIAVAIAVALALSSATVPASARTFSFNPTGSMVQQPLPPKWACELSRALGDRSSPYCRGSMTLAIAPSLALTTTPASVAWADSPPLAQAEVATFAANCGLPLSTAWADPPPLAQAEATIWLQNCRPPLGMAGAGPASRDARPRRMLEHAVRLGASRVPRKERVDRVSSQSDRPLRDLHHERRRDASAPAHALARTSIEPRPGLLGRP